MCDLNVGHDTGGVGFLVDAPEIRELIEVTQDATARVADDAARIALLKRAFARLLAADDWLPDRFARPDEKSRIGDGIGQYALYRAVNGSLCLFSLAVPPGVATPVHDHFAWGLVGVYRGRQDETIYRRLDDGSDSTQARLEVAKHQVLGRGEFYALLPPQEDIHYVRTVSATASIPIHLLANDTACVWRHKFDPRSGQVTAFRSGWANAPCEADPSVAGR